MLPQAKIEEHFTVADGTRYATRAQICALYDVAPSTVKDHILRLKKDGLLHGTEIRSMRSNGRQYTVEAYTLKEVIKIGFRLRSDFALALQDYAAQLLEERIQALQSENRQLAFENALLWNHNDTRELYTREL